MTKWLKNQQHFLLLVKYQCFYHNDKHFYDHWNWNNDNDNDSSSSNSGNACQ